MVVLAAMACRSRNGECMGTIEMELRIKDRLRAFASRYEMDYKQLSDRLYTPYGTFEKWLRKKDTQPPGVMVLVMDGIERSEEFRRLADIKEPADKERRP